MRALNFLVNLEIGKTEKVYPCRCGLTHTGEYGLFDYNHHNCFHESGITLIENDQALCVDCGKSFIIIKAEEVNKD